MPRPGGGGRGCIVPACHAAFYQTPILSPLLKILFITKKFIIYFVLAGSSFIIHRPTCVLASLLIALPQIAQHPRFNLPLLRLLLHLFAPRCRVSARPSPPRPEIHGFPDNLSSPVSYPASTSLLHFASTPSSFFTRQQRSEQPVEWRDWGRVLSSVWESRYVAKPPQKRFYMSLKDLPLNGRFAIKS